MIPVTIIVLAWNRWPLTRKLLDSIERFTDPGSIRAIVVDNGSSDETAAGLKGYPWVEVIRSEENVGFVRGNNIALGRLAPGDDVVLLNNDVEILSAGWLEQLQRSAYAAPDVGIVGCRLLLGDGRLLHAGTWIRPDDCWGEQIGSRETDLGQFTEDRQVEGIVFACAYLKGDVLRDVGWLSEEYESYFEDTDYCLRAAQKGYRTLCCGSVTMRHQEHGSTGADEDFRRRTFERSRAVFRARWRDALEARYTRSLTWQSITHLSSGYAMSCREMMRALDQEGVRLTYSYAYEGWPTVPPEPERMGDHLIDLIRLRSGRERPRVAVTYAQGDALERNRGRYKIGFTMLEVDRIPREWVRQANAMDELWTPTWFGRQAMLASGVTRPVYVIPLGVDGQHFHPRIKRVENHGGDFVFLANFEWTDRKAPELLLRTFNAAFRRTEPAVLVCKVMNRDPAVDVPNRIRALELDENGGRIHLIHNRDLPHYQLAALYRSSDCFVSPSRGEGWGMTLIEAMACALPVIATDWGGHTALLAEDDSYPLRIRGLVPAVSSCPYYDGFSWADPDPEHLAQLMRHVYENRGEAALRGVRAAARVRSTLSWKQTARAIVERLEQVDG
ncbi:MAG: glycosyl transferase, family 2 [Acidobacteria bacterium]|nr:glycosyl transferase, family 2 [Acidobacteriota bacterium]